jgi:Protein of unknown function (DUF3102)
MTAMNASNTPRSLDAIAEQIHRVERANIFAIGELLTEADDACEHGEWLPWLQANFSWWSHDTALRYMAAYKLSAKCARVRNLRVPSRIIYALASDLDDPALPAMVEALAKATKGKTKVITVADADEVIELARWRIKFGDHPAAALRALDHIDKIVEAAVEWAAGASEELKKARPDSEEAADKIVLAYRRKRLEELFGGALPDRLGEMALDWLEDVEPEHRKQVLAKLNDASQPLDWRQVANITTDARFLSVSDEDQDDDAEIDPTPEQRDDDEAPSPLDLNAEFLDALRVIVHHARRPMPTSIGGIYGAELVEAARFLDKLHELATGGSSVKRIADAAEARSRSGRAANGEGRTERWSES